MLDKCHLKYFLLYSPPHSEQTAFSPDALGFGDLCFLECDGPGIFEGEGSDVIFEWEGPADDDNGLE